MALGLRFWSPQGRGATYCGDGPPTWEPSLTLPHLLPSSQPLGQLVQKPRFPGLRPSPPESGSSWGPARNLHFKEFFKALEPEQSPALQRQVRWAWLLQLVQRLDLRTEAQRASILHLLRVPVSQDIRQRLWVGPSARPPRGDLGPRLPGVQVPGARRKPMPSPPPQPPVLGSPSPLPPSPLSPFRGVPQSAEAKALGNSAHWMHGPGDCLVFCLQLRSQWPEWAAPGLKSGPHHAALGAERLSVLSLFA